MSLTPWLERVGTETWPHRRKKAERYLRRRGERVRELQDEGAPTVRIAETQRWYLYRARAQYLRMDRVESCGTEVLEFTCENCARKHERPARCRVHLLCIKCRGYVASEKQKRFLAARAVVMADAGKRGLFFQRRRGGRWTEKLLSLTAPHLPTDTIATRIERVFCAWRAFLKILNTHLRAVDAHQSARWFRVVEWTLGTDELGHPHLHIWLFCPFLEVETLRLWWARALAACGCAVARPVIDVRLVDDALGAARELIKYLCKDIDANGDKVAPSVFAQVYCTLDQHRLTQASTRFMALAERQPARCECGGSLGQPKRIRAASPPTAAQTDEVD